MNLLSHHTINGVDIVKIFIPPGTIYPKDIILVGLAHGGNC